MSPSILDFKIVTKMADPDQALKDALNSFLSALGLRVSEIPRGTGKTPDLMIEEGTDDAVVVEIKQKSHNQAELDAYFRAMDSAGIASRSRPTGARNRLDGIISSGVGQLKEGGWGRRPFRVLWIHCEGYDAFRSASPCSRPSAYRSR